MKGLLIKDLKLLKTQKIFLLAIAAISIGFLMTGNERSFALTYAAAMISVLTVSTISYDESNNGMPFLFTLPVSRSYYVMEKYTFGTAAMTVVLAILSAIMALLSELHVISYEKGEFLSILLSAILTAVIIQSLTIPVHLKFGAEKSRIAFLVIAAGIFIIGYIIKQIGTAMGMDIPARIGQMIPSSQLFLTVGVIVLALTLTVISILISLAIMNRKQF